MTLRVAGLDLGSTHLKALCVDLGPPVTVRSLRRVRTPDAADELVTLALRMLADVTEEAGPVAAIGIASMAETGVPLDEYDEPLTPLLRWDASRPEAAVGIADDELFALTGVRLAPKTPLATWAWLADEHRRTWARMRRWAGTADLLALALTGRLATDHTLAGRTGAYPLDGDTYAPELLALVGLDPSALPEVTDDVVGTSNGVPVAVAGHDHQVGAYACGARDPGAVANSLGTAEVLMRVLRGRPDPEPVRAAGMGLVRTVGGGWALLAGLGPSGARYAAWSGDPTPLFEELSRRTRQAYVDQLALDPDIPVATPVTVFGGPGARDRRWTRIKAGLLPDGIRVVELEEPVAIGAAIVAAERAGLVEPSAIALPSTEGRGS